jgi:FkbM family methyltransferase
MAPRAGRLRRVLRPILGHPLLLPATALLLRAWTVRGSGRFVARELLRRRGPATYALRGASTSVVVRHGTGDVATLGEVFHDRLYEPPASVVALLGPDGPARVLDVGANVGMFGAWAADRWPRTRITGYEPDPVNAAAHAATIAANGLGDRWRLVQAAAADHAGEMLFVPGLDADSHQATAGDPGAITVPAHDVLGEVTAADLVKLDAEGGEWAILGDERFRRSPPPALVLEYHSHLAPGPDARAAAGTLLAAAGYTTVPIFHSPKGHGMLWAWRG